jgi:hypothetical protein
MPQNLGEKAWVAGYTFDGYVSGQRLAEVIMEVIKFIGMTPFGEPLIREWPAPGWLGGEGDSVYQVIGLPSDVFAQLVESHVTGNTYIFKDKEGLKQGRIRVCIESCKKFDTYQAGRYMKGLFNAPIIARGWFEY